MLSRLFSAAVSRSARHSTGCATKSNPECRDAERELDRLEVVASPSRFIARRY